MGKLTAREASIADATGPASAQSDRAVDPRTRRVAYGLSAVIAVLMLVASAAGSFIDGLYRDGPGRERRSAEETSPPCCSLLPSLCGR